MKDCGFNAQISLYKSLWISSLTGCLMADWLIDSFIESTAFYQCTCGVPPGAGVLNAEDVVAEVDPELLILCFNLN